MDFLKENMQMRNINIYNYITWTGQTPFVMDGLIESKGPRELL